MATPRKSQKEIAFGAEQRAVEEGHRAFVQSNGSFRVVSDTKPDTSYNVTYWGVAHIGLIHFHCTCPAGVNRPHIPVPCKHAALVGRRLEREGFARWQGGEWFVTDKALALVPAESVDDPFEGIC